MKFCIDKELFLLARVADSGYVKVQVKWMRMGRCFMWKSGDQCSTVVGEQYWMGVDEDVFWVKIFWRESNRIGYGFVFNNATHFDWLSAKKSFYMVSLNRKKTKNSMKEKTRHFVAFISFVSSSFLCSWVINFSDNQSKSSKVTRRLVSAEIIFVEHLFSKVCRCNHVTT